MSQSANQSVRQSATETLQTPQKPRVAVQRCAVDATDEAVYQAIRRAVDLIGGVPDAVCRARSIVVKPNYVGVIFKKSDQEVRLSAGGRQAHNTEPAVTEAVVRLIREANPAATIVFGEGMDLPPDAPQRTAADVFRCMKADRLVERYGVTLLDFNAGDDADFVQVPVPGGGAIQKWLWVRREIAEADTFVSVAKLKCHQTAGVTLTTKNLFGLLPRRFYGAGNRGFMHQNAFRLMRTFVDVNTAFRQSLSILDGLVGTTGGMNGEPLEVGCVLAGTNHLATDAVAMTLMGFDPQADFPNAPFLISESHLKLCEAKRLGTLDLAQITQLGEAPTSFGVQFETRPEQGFSTEMAGRIIEAARAQAGEFLRHESDYLREYAGKYIFIVDGRVVAQTDTIAEAATIRPTVQREHGPGIGLLAVPAAQRVERLEAYAGD
ncbi:MAG TPA: DUF362 domain-containing protein [Chloroflexota bacterium]|nr:DUF362 domain-containing protein [Chloroflexota bacterium]